MRSRAVALAPAALFFAATLALAIVLRAQHIEFISSDYRFFLSHWIDIIRQKGLGQVYGIKFSNYTPLYTYFLGLFDYFFSGLHSLYTVKYVSFVGEAFSLFWVYRVMRVGFPAPSERPLMALILVMLCPSMVINGAITGQCDAWLMGFVLMAVYYLLKGKSDAVLLCAGLAFAFKPQAVFFAPLLVILLLRGDLKWRQLWLIPATYFLSCSPAWLEGRQALDLFSIYPSQMYVKTVSYSAANPYWFLNGYKPDEVKIIGAVLAAMAATYLVMFFNKRWKNALTLEKLLLLAVLFSALMPFMLPMMHDRYFFMADIFSLMLACAKPRWFILPLLLQTSSFIASPHLQVPRFSGFAGWVQSLGMPVAIGLNAAAIMTILWICFFSKSAFPCRETALSLTP